MRYKRRHTKTTTKKKQPQKTVIQHHHITYNPEWTVAIFKGEHWIICQMNYRKRISQGFITILKNFIQEHEKNATNLGPEKRDSSL